jgi:hypothetical protein
MTVPIKRSRYRKRTLDDSFKAGRCKLALP